MPAFSYEIKVILIHLTAAETYKCVKIPDDSTLALEIEIGPIKCIGKSSNYRYTITHVIKMMYELLTPISGFLNCPSVPILKVCNDQKNRIKCSL